MLWVCVIFGLKSDVPKVQKMIVQFLLRTENYMLLGFFSYIC